MPLTFHWPIQQSLSLEAGDGELSPTGQATHITGHFIHSFTHRLVGRRGIGTGKSASVEEDTPKTPVPGGSLVGSAATINELCHLRRASLISVSPTAEVGQ